MREFPNASQQSRTILDFDCLPLWAHASTLILLHLSRVRVRFNTVAYNGKRQIGLHIPTVEVRSTKRLLEFCRATFGCDRPNVRYNYTWGNMETACRSQRRSIRHDSIKTLEWCRTFLSRSLFTITQPIGLWKMRVSTLTARRFSFMTDCFRDIDSTAHAWSHQRVEW